MMKKLLLLPAMLMAFSMVMAQNIETKSVQVGTVTAPGFSVTIQKKADLVQDAMNKRLKDADLKTKKSEGFIAVLDQSEEDDEFSVSTGTYGGGLLLQWRYAMSFDALDGARVGRGDLDFSARLSLLHSTFSEIVGQPSGWGLYLQLGLGFGYGSYRRAKP